VSTSAPLQFVVSAEDDAASIDCCHFQQGPPVWVGVAVEFLSDHFQSGSMLQWKSKRTVQSPLPFFHCVAIGLPHLCVGLLHLCFSALSLE